jgi:endonuclease-3
MIASFKLYPGIPESKGQVSKTTNHSIQPKWHPRKAIQILMVTKIGRKFPVKVWKTESPFATLIHTILSQNTNDRNSEAAMKKLRNRYSITPSVLANANENELMTCIRSAGLYTIKAPRIKEISRIVQNEYGGRLAPILRLPYNRAKEKLMTLPGVGPKTADILMAFVAKHHVIPVDTHVARVTKRLGIAPMNANYETIRTSLETLIRPENRVRLHLSMIEFGRAVCKAPKPNCSTCPVNKWCPSNTV